MDKYQSNLTKTDKVLRALIGICQNAEDRITEEDLCALLDFPSRAQKYKLISELLEQKEYRPPILIKYDFGGSVTYGLNLDFYLLLH